MTASTPSASSGPGFTMAGPASTAAPLLAAARLDTHTSQRVFRTTLEAMSHPASVVPLPDAPTVLPTALLVPLALADVAIGVAVVDPDPDGFWSHVVARAIDSPPRPPQEAAFCVFLRPPNSLELAALPRGTAYTPEDGATVVIAVDRLHPDGLNGTTKLLVRGPGVNGTRRLGVDGLDRDVVDAIGRCNANLPAGIDTVLVSATSLAALPRTTRIDDAEIY